MASFSQTHRIRYAVIRNAAGITYGKDHWDYVDPRIVKTLSGVIGKAGIQLSEFAAFLTPDFSDENEVMARSTPIRNHTNIYFIHRGLLNQGLKDRHILGSYEGGPPVWMPNFSVSSSSSMSLPEYYECVGVEGANESPVFFYDSDIYRWDPGDDVYEAPTSTGGLIMRYSRVGGNFPSGITLNGETGVFSGTIYPVGYSSTVTIRAHGCSEDADLTLRFTVSDVPPGTEPAALSFEAADFDGDFE